jgi:RNA methyltransferase, TrmH family
MAATLLHPGALGPQGMKQITSKNNPLFKSIVELARSSRARREEGRTVLDGVHLVQAYLQQFGAQGVDLIIKHGAVDHAEIAALSNEAPAVTFSDALFDQAAPVKSPVGILARVPIRRAPDRPHGQGFQVLLDGVQDPGNLGAILRSAAAAGGVLAHLSGTCADPWSPKALRGGMGAQFVLEIRESQDLLALIGALGVPLVACVPDSATSLFGSDLSGPVAFAIGGEGRGISPELLAHARRTIRIPMQPGIESLNAGAAAAICFFEWARQNGVSRGHS